MLHLDSTFLIDLLHDAVAHRSERRAGAEQRQDEIAIERCALRCHEGRGASRRCFDLRHRLEPFAWKRAGARAGDA